jgi:hypothetical protein
VLCFLCGRNWNLKYYLQELRLQQVNNLPTGTWFQYNKVNFLISSVINSFSRVLLRGNILLLCSGFRGSPYGTTMMTTSKLLDMKGNKRCQSTIGNLGGQFITIISIMYATVSTLGLYLKRWTVMWREVERFVAHNSFYETSASFRRSKWLDYYLPYMRTDST